MSSGLKRSEVTIDLSVAPLIPFASAMSRRAMVIAVTHDTVHIAFGYDVTLERPSELGLTNTEFVTPSAETVSICKHLSGRPHALVYVLEAEAFSLALLEVAATLTIRQQKHRV